jgi:cell division protein FtsQ
MNQAVRKQSQAVPEAAPVTARLLWSMLLTLALLVAVGYVGQSLTRTTSFPIKKVTVEGDFRFLTPGYIQTLVGRSLHGGFFQLDVQEIRRSLLEEPWVMEATIERIWPDVLRVSINEQRPAAQWGKHALLNTAADMFAPGVGTFPQDLPQLSGPVGSESEVLATYRLIAARMAALDLSVAWLELSERGAWTVGLTDETRLILGRHRIDERLQRFRQGFESALKENWHNVESIDLRYTNGFAIQERKLPKADLELEKRGG